MIYPMTIPQHIIISRTDNIGDVVLTLPMAAIIKQRWPSCKVSFLARDYVADVINACPDVDAFISWDELQNLDHTQAISQLNDADTIIHVYPQKAIAKLAKAAGIKQRIGTSRRLHHWLNCNKRVKFSRKDSSLHEAQLNLALLAPLGLPTMLSLPELTELTRLNKSPDVAPAVKPFLDADKFNCVLHALTNGNTKEWPLANFSALIDLLGDKINIIITGTAKEASTLAPLLSKHPHVKNAVGQLTLTEFINLLSHANGVVVNSTGPLHIAAALGTQVLGLFPPEKGKDVGRWGPLGQHASAIEAMLCPACENTRGNCTCMENITPQQVEAHIETWH